MSNPIPELHLVNKQLVKKTIDQLNKDLAGLGCIHFPTGKDFYPKIINQLTSTLRTLKTSDFQSLVYRIDLAENRLKELMQTKTGIQYYKSVAELIIEREFKKVYIRSIYS